jgi:hypothetical protein
MLALVSHTADVEVQLAQSPIARVPREWSLGMIKPLSSLALRRPKDVPPTSIAGDRLIERQVLPAGL